MNLVHDRRATGEGWEAHVGQEGEAGDTSGSWWSRRTAGLDGRFWKLWGAVASSNLGDGLASLAFPWLASLLTRDALAISGVALATRLPWLVFSLQAGALGDRVDRRRLMVGANTVRAVVAGGAALAVAGDVMTLPLLYLAAFVLGMCEVLFDNTSQALLPAIVPRARLERANGNIMGAQMVIADFLSRPVAGALIGVGLSLPFAIDAVTAAVSAALVAMIPGRYGRAPDAAPAAEVAPTGQVPAAPTPRVSMRTQIGEGLRWLWDHRLLRTLAFALATLNGLGAATMATIVLFAQEILELGSVGFGLLLVAGGVGGLAGSVLGPTLAARIGSGPAMLTTMVVPIVTGLIIATTSSAWVVAACMVAQSFTAIVWNVVTVSLRQTMIPDAILGRVNSVYRFFGWGVMPLGTLLGGGLVSVVEQQVSRDIGLRAPFAAAAVIHVVLVAVAGRRLTTAAVEEAKAAAPER